MSSNYRRTTAPVSEPVSIEEVKLNAHIDHDVEDDIIHDWIKAGVVAAENFQWRSFCTQEWEMVFDCFPPSLLVIPRPPLKSIVSIKYYDEDNNEFDFDLNDIDIDTVSCPGRIMLSKNVYWPSVTLRNLNGVIITFISGYGTGDDLTTTNDSDVESIPKSVKLALYQYCTWANENREGEDDIPKSFYAILRPDRVHISL